MMRFDRFTEQAQEAAQLAAEIIKRYGHNQIDTEHIMLALLEQDGKTISLIFKKLKVNTEFLKEKLDTSLRASPKAKLFGGDSSQIYITPRVKRIIDISNEEANQFKDEYISTEHLLLAILTERNTPVARILESGNVVTSDVLAVIKDSRKRPVEKPVPKRSAAITNNDIFIVHGHDDAMKEAVARTIEKIGLNAIVLHERPNQGKTIIEKFTNYSDVGFAIVLLSPDDISLSKHDASDKKSFRARQNVIFELGFFIGKLGRDRVISLYRQVDGFELPSDYSGVLYIPFDDYHHWRFDIIRELKASGYKLDANKLLE